jgi:cytochrome c peroxidase
MSKHLLVAGLIAVAVYFAVAAAAADAPPAKTGPHGDTPVEQQLAALTALTGEDPTQVPRGVDSAIWEASIPTDNAVTAVRVELGRKLYFDVRLSADNTVSCATCHDVNRAFTDRRPTSEGIKDQRGTRNAPTTMNAALLENQFWDGRAATLEEQALLPILNPIEMGMPDEKAAVSAVADDPEYTRLFKEAYGRQVNYDDIGRAIAAFERTLIFLDAPADYYLAGEAGAASDAAKRGLLLFNGKARCTACHPMSQANPLGTDNRFHNIGVSARNQKFEELAARALGELKRDPSLANIERLALATELSELGRFMISRNYSDVGAFRTPQIRNVGITAPYMHDGSMETLWDVIDHYNKGGEANTYLDGGIEPLGLTEAEIDDLVAFMFALTDQRFAAENDAEMNRQRLLSRSKRPFRDDDLAHRKTFSFDPRK